MSHSSVRINGKMALPLASFFCYEITESKWICVLQFQCLCSGQKLTLPPLYGLCSPLITAILTHFSSCLKLILPNTVLLDNFLTTLKREQKSRWRWRTKFSIAPKYVAELVQSLFTVGFWHTVQNRGFVLKCSFHQEWPCELQAQHTALKWCVHLIGSKIICASQ